MRVVRSVALPGVTPHDAVASDIRLAALTKQLAEVRSLADERAAALIRDRAAMRDEGARRESRDRAVMRDLEVTVETLQTKLTNLTRGEGRGKERARDMGASNARSDPWHYALSNALRSRPLAPRPLKRAPARFSRSLTLINSPQIISHSVTLRQLLNALPVKRRVSPVQRGSKPKAS